jgi:hypothetical protein
MYCHCTKRVGEKTAACILVGMIFTSPQEEIGLLVNHRSRKKYSGVQRFPREYSNTAMLCGSIPKYT